MVLSELNMSQNQKIHKTYPHIFFQIYEGTHVQIDKVNNQKKKKNLEDIVQEDLYPIETPISTIYQFSKIWRKLIFFSKM